MRRARLTRSALLLATLLALQTAALAAPPSVASTATSTTAAAAAAAPRGWFSRTWDRVRPWRAAADRGPATAATASGEGSHRITLRQTWAKVREEFQLYRGERLERIADRFAVGRPDFDAQRSVAANLESLVKEKNIPHYYAEVNGRQVLHVVVDLGQGKETKQTLRSLLRRIGAQTAELNYKASNEKNRYGHVAVRLGDGATYDLTGTRGVSELPRPLARILEKVRGQSDLSFARKRNLRRFMETRRDGPELSPSLFYGMLFSATPAQLAETDTIYRQRQRAMTGFNVGGGDAKAGVFSCAQFLTEDIPFLNQRGVKGTVGARSAASAARGSPGLEAVLVYRTPGVTDDQLRSSLP